MFTNTGSGPWVHGPKKVPYFSANSFKGRFEIFPFLYWNRISDRQLCFNLAYLLQGLERRREPGLLRTRPSHLHSRLVWLGSGFAVASHRLEQLSHVLVSFQRASTVGARPCNNPTPMGLNGWSSSSPLPSSAGALARVLTNPVIHCRLWWRKQRRPLENFGDFVILLYLLITGILSGMLSFRRFYFCTFSQAFHINFHMTRNPCDLNRAIYLFLVHIVTNFCTFLFLDEFLCLHVLW